MTIGAGDARPPENGPLDIGAYCRAVERHLTRVNGGHLVRIVGPAFDLVRRWAEDGVPLKVVFHAIDLKAERHRAGRSARPLRIEFCESDVRALFDHWRRAVGVTAGSAADDSTDEGDGGRPRRAPSLSKHLDRVVERLSHTAGRVDLPEAFRDAVSRLLSDVTALRERARGARGTARAALETELPAFDRALIEAARRAVAPVRLASLTTEAERDLAPFRHRLGGPEWMRAVDATVDRLLREEFRLPVMTSEGSA